MWGIMNEHIVICSHIAIVIEVISEITIRIIIIIIISKISFPRPDPETLEFHYTGSSDPF